MSAAQKSECPGGTGQNAEQHTNTVIISQPDGTDKRLTTIKAELARRAFAVHNLAEGGFVVCRWNMSCHCQDLAALVAFARRVGVQP